MTNNNELKTIANNLRKSGDITNALPLYKTLWDESNDKFDGAGLLHCLRKLKMFDEALPLADSLLAKYKSFKWCRLEIVWTYIEGKLKQFPEREPLENVLLLSNEILNLEPEDIALRKVVFFTLKFAKNANNWSVINEWLTKIDPLLLSKDPILENNRNGWSYYTLWYNYKINALIKEGLYSQAIQLIKELMLEIPRGQQKFFNRLEALAYFHLNEHDNAEQIYKILCSHTKADWWLLHEYAKVLMAKGENLNALKLMYQAAVNNPRLESMVTLFLDISTLCAENNNLENSRNHLYLTLYVREKYEWNVPKDLHAQIISINQEIGNNNKPKSLNEALRLCKIEWKIALESDTTHRQNPSIRNKKTNLIGVVKMGQIDKPFCFILSNNDSIFCYKSNLPLNILDNNSVIFDIIPTFDKKKNTESWKAVNIRLDEI